MGERRYGREVMHRPGTNDLAILEEAGRDYWPGVVPYWDAYSVVDVGAHIGGFALWLANINPDVAITCIEPDADNYRLLTQNVAELRNVRTAQARLGYEAGPVVAFRNPENTGGFFYTSRERAMAQGETWHRLWGVSSGNWYGASLTLEKIAPGPDYDVLKLDCEGGEFEALLRAEMETLLKFAWIVGEWHSAFGDWSAVQMRLRGAFEFVRELDKGGGQGLFCLRRR